MRKLAILLAVLIVMPSSAMAAPILNGKTFKGTGYGVDIDGYKTMPITMAVKSQNGSRFTGNVTTSSGGVTKTQKFFGVISATNQIYMVVNDGKSLSDTADVMIDANYNPTANTISGFWRGLHSSVGYFTLKKL